MISNSIRYFDLLQLDCKWLLLDRMSCLEKQHRLVDILVIQTNSMETVCFVIMSTFNRPSQQRCNSIDFFYRYTGMLYFYAICFLASKTGFSAIFTSTDKSFVTPHVRSVRRIKRKTFMWFQYIGRIGCHARICTVKTLVVWTGDVKNVRNDVSLYYIGRR